MSAAMRSPLTWGIVAGLVLGKFIGITGATWLMQRLRLGPAGAGPDIAPGRRRRCAVRNRFHHLAFHRRHRDRRSDCARTRRASACCSRRCLAFLLGWAIFRITDWVSPPRTGRAQADSARRPRPRPHPRQARRAADPRRVRRFRVPVLQPCHRIDRRGARALRRRTALRVAAPAAGAGAPARVRRGDGPPRRPRCRASSARWRRELFEHQDDLEWSDIYRYAVTDRAATSNGSTRTCGCTRRRCCTGCRTMRRTPS